MLKQTFLIGSTAFWLTMTSLLLRREFFVLTPIQAPYEVLPLHNLYLREEYRAIYLGSERIGFGFTVLEKMDEKIDGTKDYAYELRHNTYLSFLFLGKKREMLVRGKAHLDPQLYLQAFQARISSGDYWTNISGRIIKGELRFSVEGKEGDPIHKMILLPEPVLFSEALHLVWTPDNLKIGKRGRLRIWNPLLMNFEDVGFHVAYQETIAYEGKNTEVFVVLAEKGGIETRAWVNTEGVVLREETPMGLMMQKEEPWEIFDAMRQKKSEQLPDLPNLFSVPSNLILKNPLAFSYLKATIKLPEGERQVETKRPDFEGLETVPLPVPLPDPSFAAFLESTPLIQATDPIIQEQARRIAGEEKTALLASLRLLRWVHQNVAPIPSLTLPSARQVLAVKKGDCNEYAVLFTALARSLGIPTKTVAGLVYQDGRFFYHAWAEVYLGRWVALDPTFDQAPADVTHIPLVEGNLEEQVALASKIGRIKVIILETQ